MSIASTILITSLITGLPNMKHPDLCDVVNPDTGTPILCEAHRSDAPVYDDNICCDANSCGAATADGCNDGQSTYSCWLGEVLASNEVSCYFEVPDYCDVYPCGDHLGYGSHPQELMLCCQWGICYPYSAGSGECPLGDIIWCGSGVSNPDGTIECLD